jgi:hypothetical protein
VTLLSLDRILQTRSNPEGSFRFEGLKTGLYAIEISAPGFAKRTVSVTLQPGHLNENVSLVLNVGSMPDMEKCGRDVSISYVNIDAVVYGPIWNETRLRFHQKRPRRRNRRGRTGN